MSRASEIIARHRRKSGRQPSGEDHAVKLERMYNALRAEREKSKNASQYNEQAIRMNEELLHAAWRLYTDQLKATTIQ